MKTYQFNDYSILGISNSLKCKGSLDIEFHLCLPYLNKRYQSHRRKSAVI